MADTPQHTYQVLTKRARRLRQVADRLDWPAIVWMGVSVETGRELPLRDRPGRAHPAQTARLRYKAAAVSSGNGSTGAAFISGGLGRGSPAPGNGGKLPQPSNGPLTSHPGHRRPLLAG
nr:DUF5131 family protein [Streptomyces sp. CB02120-2]